MKKLICFVSMALMLFSMLAIDVATAAPAVGTAKARGDYSNKFFQAQSAGRSVRHARDYSQGYRSYGRQVPNVMPQYARQEEAGVGQNITTAQKQYTEMRRATTDTQVLASLDTIDKHLAEAVKAHKLMHEMCTMETIDGVSTMKCCDDIDAALEKAIAEHEKMMKRLASETATTSASN
jgi:hypothetical protein